MNQNMTVDLVFFITLRIMMEAKRCSLDPHGWMTHLVEQARSDGEDIDLRMSGCNLCSFGFSQPHQLLHPESQLCIRLRFHSPRHD